MKVTDSPLKKKNIGSTLDSLFDERGESEDVELLTQKELLAARIERAMAKRNMSQAELARTMRTSRTVILGCSIRATRA